MSKPDIRGLGENVKEFEWFIFAFFSSWLMSLLFWTPLIYWAMIIKDTQWDGLSERGKIHVSTKI